MKYIKAGTFVVVSLFVAAFGYLEAIAFSAALPIPDIVVEHTKSSGNPSNAYYWAFILLTLNLPFALLAALCSFLSGRYMYVWLAPIAFSIALIYLRGLTLDPGHWWSVFIMTLAVCSLLALMGKKTRYKELK